MYPRDRFVVANRLRHHLLEWGDKGPIVLLLHGFLEHAHAWDLVAPHLVAAGFHVLALDWRGHGDSEWIGAGGYYHFADYTADLAFLVRVLGGEAGLVGHSMGGGAAVAYAGTEPERVRALVSIEGLGLPGASPDAAPDRFRAWLGDLERVAQRQRHELKLEAVAGRLRERFPGFSTDVVWHMAQHGTRPHGTGRVWKFDPLHQTSSPQPYYVAQARAFWQRVTCPVLYIEGSRTPLRLPRSDLEERLTSLRAERVAIEGSGHHPHLERPEALAQVIVEFLERAMAPLPARR